MITSFSGFLSLFCFGLPVVVIMAYRLYRHTSLIALAAYYLLTLAHCLSAPSVPPVPDFNNSFDVAYTYLEIPLVLMALLFFCPVKQRQQPMQRLIVLFTVYELGVLVVAGFTARASLFIMVPGLVVVLAYSTYLFVRQLRFTCLHGKNWGRVLMLAAILFSYGTYGSVIYHLLMQKNTAVAEAYNTYFVSTVIASVLMSAGLVLMRYRIKELQELKIVRKELQMVFGG